LEKQIRLDVNCVTDSGEQINVEMQSEREQGDSLKNDYKGIRSRCVFYLAKTHLNQITKRKKYANFVRTFHIIFCGYPLFKDRKDPISYINLRREDGKLFSDDLNICFIELSKLGHLLKKPIGELSGAEMWALFIKYIGNPKHTFVIKDIISARREIKMAQDALINISKDGDFRAKQILRHKYLADNENAMLVHEARGITKGITKGKIEVALNLLKQGLPPKQIADATKLPLSKIEKLATN
jgi:predicted transposase/invertase (TIGR01784 family)